MKTILAALLVAFGFASQAGESIHWHEDFDQAMAEAKSSGKPLFLDFYAEWCGPCKMMDRKTYPDLAVIKQMERLVAVRIDVDQNEALAKQYRGNARKYGGNGIPAMIVVDTGGNELYRHHGFLSAPQLTAALAKVNDKTESK